MARKGRKKIRAFIVTKNNKIRRQAFTNRKSLLKNPNVVNAKLAKRLKKLNQAKIEEFNKFQQLLQSYQIFRRENPTRLTPKRVVGARAAPTDGEPRAAGPPGRGTVSAPRTERRGATYITTFKAAGSLETERGITFGDSYKRGLMEEEMDISETGGFAVPALFFSNQGSLLGRVKFSGQVDLDTLITLLNDKLQFIGEESADFDFRRFYSKWEYSYQVIERLGPTTRVIESDHQRRG